MSEKLKSIVLFTRKMNGVMGGLERQIIQIAKIFTESNYQIYIITLDQTEITTFYDSSFPNVSFIPIRIGDPDLTSSLKIKMKRQKRIYEYLREIEPDIGIGFMFGGFLMSRIPMLLIRKPLILAERNSPSMYTATKVSRLRFFLFFTMFFSSAITVQFAGYKNKYPWFLRSKIRDIPNTIFDTGYIATEESENVRYVFAGRFSFQKQILKLIEGFSVFHQIHPMTSLTLFGEGELESQINELIASLNLKNCVKISKSTDIRKIFAVTDVLCLTSIWEGFPNVLAEALKSGIPAIGFSNCDGVSDLITDGLNGWLELDTGMNEDVIKLLERSYCAVKNKAIRSNEITSSMSIYSDEIIIQKWLELVENLAP